MVQKKENNHERFLYAFRVRKNVILEVNFAAIAVIHEDKWLFSTFAKDIFRNRKHNGLFRPYNSEFDKILPICSTAQQFYEKWITKHYEELSKAEYDELKQDIEILKSKYLYIYKDENYPKHEIPYLEIEELSMRKDEKQKSVLAEIQIKGTSSGKTVGAKPLDKER